ncbi:sugar phosphate isomerase/epimerase family protein [Falsibacillus albus]|uniref:Sugar phosphate isomerase/epimerase n=1 Tax=Falsibacillus albus TaxID=2478915 RepID=A0A3L7K2K6_9BACI|nr:sugar phosphate isomerase/epimerase [Falsibacillus albus]RLQ96604.1 sugar phosphate isomerase/epimerase [Falsibacillus albus]
MKLGYLTNSLVHHGITDLNEIVDWSIQHGFQALEIGPNIPFDQLKRVIEEKSITISALTYCRNFLSANEDEANHHRMELKSRVEKAGELGIPMVVTSTGICSDARGDFYDDFDAIRSKPENSLDQVCSFFDEIIQLAERVNVKVAFENCPLMGNIAISPDLWAALFEKLDSPNAGLAYDPSHLIWQFIDPYLPIKEFNERIIHVHAKDTEIDHERLKRKGFLTDFSWWRYRLPGLGELKWSKFLSELAEIGYEGTISIEHEDPVWGGDLEKTKQGLLLSKRTLENQPSFF